MPRLLDELDAGERDALLDELRSEGRRVLQAAGVPDDAIIFRYGVDARYAGQGNEITIWVGEGEAWPASTEDVVAEFEAEYRRIYGMAIPDVAVEGITWRLSAFATTSIVEPDQSIEPATGDPVAKGTRAMVFGRGVEAVEAPVYDRASLGAGASFDGPCVVEERETTSVIRPGWHVEVAPDGSLLATRKDKS